VVAASLRIAMLAALIAAEPVVAGTPTSGLRFNVQ